MGIVFDIQKFSVFDGPGIRTAVFLKGCMMRCPWCHNPESLKPDPELSCDLEKCVSCGACVQVCPNGVHSLGEDGRHRVDYSKCAACGRCLAACPLGCLKVFGREMAAADVVAEVLKDRNYYESSGGGVTFTGGEPTFQYGFLLELLERSKAEGLHTCLETNGVIPPERLGALLPLTDLFLLDYKATGEDHKRLTNVEEGAVLRTLAALDEAGKDVVLRCPVIQGVNDTEAHFAAIRDLRARYGCIGSAEVMAYHSSGRHKWRSLGEDYTLDRLESATPEMKAAWEEKIRVSQ